MDYITRWRYLADRAFALLPFYFLAVIFWVSGLRSYACTRRFDGPINWILFCGLWHDKAWDFGVLTSSCGDSFDGYMEILLAYWIGVAVFSACDYQHSVEAKRSFKVNLHLYSNGSKEWCFHFVIADLFLAIKFLCEWREPVSACGLKTFKRKSAKVNRECNILTQFIHLLQLCRIIAIDYGWKDRLAVTPTPPAAIMPWVNHGRIPGDQLPERFFNNEEVEWSYGEPKNGMIPIHCNSDVKKDRWKDKKRVS